MTHSENLAQIATALAKAQGAIVGASKDATNPHFKSKYADLAAVWDACRKPLSVNELAVFQPARFEDGAVHVETLLVHSSGEWIRETLVLKPRDETPQSVGSAITYGRRYGLSAMVGVAPDDDDDGQAASYSNGASRTQSRTSDQVTFEFVTPDQQKRLIGAARESGWSGAELATWLKTSGYNAWSKVPSADFDTVLTKMQKDTGVPPEDAPTPMAPLVGVPTTDLGVDDIPF